MEQVSLKNTPAFLTLEMLTDQCLTSKQRVELLEDEDDESLVPTGHILLQKIVCEHSSEILKYLSLFLLPVIRNLQFSR